MKLHAAIIGIFLLTIEASGLASPETAATSGPSESTSDLSAANSGLVQQLARLRDRMHALSDQIRGTGSKTHPTSRPTPTPLLELERLTCQGCSRELGLVPPSVAENNSKTLAAFPGVPRVYHWGATDFFLDHAKHLGLSESQQLALGESRQRALMARADTTREMEAADQVLFRLTAADQPDIAQIEQQVRRIEALRRTRRLAFIRAVGEAAQILLEAQRRIIAGADS